MHRLLPGTGFSRPMFSAQRLKPLSLAIALGLSSLAVAPVALSQTAGALQVYNISAGPLDIALTRIARESGRVIVIDPALVKGLKAAAIQGELSMETAFARALSGSGLVLITRQDKTLGVQRSDGAATLPAVEVNATAQYQDATEGSGSYTTPAASVGGKMGESLREVPRSVSVITRQQLDDQRLLSFYDVMGQLPGVSLDYGTGNGTEVSFYSRGHALTNVMADGMSISVPYLGNSRGGGSNSGMAKYDNIQLLRGPNALFAGNGEPSGSINLVRKRPLETFQAKTSLSAGSWDNYAGEVDISSPLTDDGRIRGRAVLARNTTEHFYDSSDTRKSTIYGIVDAVLGDKTVLSFGGSLDTQHGAPEQPPGLPRYADGNPLRVSSKVGYPDWVERSYDTENIFATVEHQFNEQWKLKTGVSLTDTDKGNNTMTLYQGIVNPATNISAGSVATTRVDWDTSVDTIDFNLSGSFNALNREHKVSIGADYSERSQYSLIYYHNDPLPIPDWTNFQTKNFRYPQTMYKGWDNTSERKEQGIYAYGHFQIQGPLKLVLGGRYSTFEAYNTGTNGFPLEDGNCPSWSTTCDAPIAVKTNDNNGIFTPYVGLIYDFSQHWSAYLTRAESYEDQSDYYTSEHSALDPTEGTSWEAGIKGEHANGRLNSNITFYRTERNNYRVSVGSDENFNLAGRNCCYRGDGEFLAQGVELDISGALTANWQINAGYTYDDNKTEYGANDGKRYASYAPKHIFRLWSSYQFEGALSKLRVGGGVQAQSGFFRSGTVRAWNPTGGLNGQGAFDGPSVAYDFTEPGRALWNGFAEYRFDQQWSVGLNVNNLFDKKYYQTVGTTTGNNSYGMPRSWAVTLRGGF